MLCPIREYFFGHRLLVRTNSLGPDCEEKRTKNEGGLTSSVSRWCFCTILRPLEYFKSHSEITFNIKIKSEICKTVSQGSMASCILLKMDLRLRFAHINGAMGHTSDGVLLLRGEPAERKGCGRNEGR